jgi:hypothetical protein
MLEQLEFVYVDKLSKLYRYKKNLLNNLDLEKEVNKLECYLEIWSWVKEKDWINYIDQVKILIGEFDKSTIKTNLFHTSPIQNLEIEYL